MRIVVTGASGLIGQSLLERLSGAHDVWALSRHGDGAGGRGTALACDLASGRLPDGLPAQADAVIHLAQSSRFREFPDQALDVFTVNTASTALLLDWSRRAGVRHFILASSGGLGAGAGEQPYYLSSKLAAEALASSYATLFEVLVLRFFFVYGRHQNASMLVPRMIESVRHDRAIRLPGGTGPRLNPVHVSDAAGAILAALDRRVSGTIDVAGPQQLTLREMCDDIGRQLQRQPRFEELPTEPVLDLVGDISQMRDRLAAPTLGFSEGVAELLGDAGRGR